MNGLSEVTPYSDQESGTSADMLNVFPFGSDGRLRGSRRPGLDKFCSTQVNGTAKVECVVTVSATKVDPVLGAANVFIKGNVGSTLGFSVLAAATGVEQSLHGTDVAFGAVFGPDEHVYVVFADSNLVKLVKYNMTGTQQWETPMFTDSSTPAEVSLLGMAIDEDTVFVWYALIDNIGEGIMRFDIADGSNRDSTTKGVFVRAEADATSIERAFGGVTGGGTLPAASPAWNVIPTTSHSGMKLYQGKMALIGAPLKDGGTNQEHQLVLYIMDLKTGIIDATHELSFDGTTTSNLRGIFLDIEFGLDGFIYILFQDEDTVGSKDVYLIRKVDSAGNGIWEIKMDNPAAPKSICWNPDRGMLVIVGDTLFGDAQISLAVIEPDSKGIVDYARPEASDDWECVRCDSDGNYYLWNSTHATLNVIKLAPADLVTAAWSKTLTSVVSQSKVAVNQFWNSGADEQGSTRYQETIAISGGAAYELTESLGVGTGYDTSTVIPGSPTFSTTVNTIYSANFGVLVFFADGENAWYYDPSEGANGTMMDWKAEVIYGILPNDSNGGFPYIESWDRRLIIFGLTNDPSNWYMCAENNPFDWKQQSNVIGASISGRTSPAGLYPRGDRIYGVIPYNEDLVIFAGDHTMYQLSGDPAVDSKFDLITDTVGIAPGRAWCKDGFGAVYFFGNNGGIYKMSLNSPPQRISNRSIDKRFENIDLPNSIVHLIWDSLLQGIHVFITPTDGTTNTTQYYFDFRTEGWFPYQFASVNYQPYSVNVFEQDLPQDQKILLGCKDGYIRKFNNTLNTDDNTLFSGHFTLGPWIPREGSNHQLMLHRMDLVVGAGSSLKCEVLSGIDAEDVVTDGRTIYSTKLNEKRSNTHHPRVSGKSLMVKVKSEDTVARGMNFEAFKGQMADVRNL